MVKQFNFHFRRQPNGSYRFETSEGRTFEVASRQITRQSSPVWSLTEIEYAEGREIRTRIDGSFASRTDAASAAYWVDRSAEFWATLDRVGLR